MLQNKWQEDIEGGMDEEDMDEEQLQLHREITKRRKAIVDSHRKTKQLHGGNSVMPRSRVHPKSISDMQEGLKGMGMQAGRAVERARSASAVRLGRKRQRSVAAQRGASRGGDVEMAADESEAATKRVHSSRSRSMSRGMAQHLASSPATVLCWDMCFLCPNMFCKFAVSLL